MDLETQSLFSVVVLLVLNNMLVRFRRLRGRTVLYYGIQTLDGCVAAYLILLGLPGFRHMPAVSVMLGLLLVFHMVQNARWRRAALRQLANEEAADDRREAIRKALEDDEASR